MRSSDTRVPFNFVILDTTAGRSGLACGLVNTLQRLRSPLSKGLPEADADHYGQSLLTSTTAQLL